MTQLSHIFSSLRKKNMNELTPNGGLPQITHMLLLLTLKTVFTEFWKPTLNCEISTTETYIWISSAKRGIERLKLNIVENSS